MNLCLVCDKEIEHLARKGNQPKFCSDAHRTEWKNSRVANWKRDHPERRWLPKIPQQTCDVCGKSFTPWNKGQTYCSRSCRSKHLMSFRKKPLPTCELCGKTCSKLGRRFCSRECKVEWYRGKEVYNYAGGQAREHYASSFWMSLAEEIRQRDKVCQRCGQPPRPGTKLHVHHIHPWRFSKNDDHSNLQALCPSCHKKADSELGL